MVAIVVAAALAAAGVQMDLGTPLERAQRAGCAHAAQGAAAPGTTGGPDNYRAAVDFAAADLIAVTYRKAHRRAPARVERASDGRCAGPVPRVSHRAVRADATGLRRRIAGRLCTAIENANYAIDQATVDEWGVRYDAIAAWERAARRRAGRSTRIPAAAAVRRTCRA